MDLKELYRDVILDHNRQPRNFGQLEAPDSRAEGHNPLCGDRLSLAVRLNGERIEDIRFEGRGCAISTASASLMTEAVEMAHPRPSKRMSSMRSPFRRTASDRRSPQSGLFPSA